MGRTNEKMYGSYSDADLNDWEKFPMNASVLTSSAFGAWLLRRDERRDKAIPKADYENRLKADLEAILVELQLEIEEYKRDLSNKDITKDHEDFDHNNLIEVISGNIQQKINALKEK